MYKIAVKWEPDYWQDEGLPSSGCFGYVNGHLILGKGHHQLIMARLISAGWTWEQLMEAEQAWGWYNLENVQYYDGYFDVEKMKDWQKYSYFVHVMFTSDAGYQNEDAKQGALGAFAAMYHLPAREDKSYGSYGVEKGQNKEYGSGLKGLQNADKYLKDPKHYFQNQKKLFQNVPQPPGSEWDPEWEEKLKNVTNPDVEEVEQEQKQYMPEPEKHVIPSTVPPAVEEWYPSLEKQHGENPLNGIYFTSGSNWLLYTNGYATWYNNNGNVETPTSPVSHETMQGWINSMKIDKVGPKTFGGYEGVYVNSQHPDTSNHLHIDSDSATWKHPTTGDVVGASVLDPASIKNHIDQGKLIKAPGSFSVGDKVIYNPDEDPNPPVYEISTVTPNFISVKWPGMIYPNEEPYYDIEQFKKDFTKVSYTPGGKTKGWGDIMEKANYIRGNGGVQITSNEPQHVTGTVQSGTDPGNKGPYHTEIWRDDPQSQAITMWDCDCDWDQYAWGRCVVMGSMITMGDGTTKPIEEVVVSDPVIDHTGNIGIVSDIWQEHWNDNIIILNDILKVKPTHPILIIKGEKIKQNNITKKQVPSLHHQARLRSWSYSGQPEFVLAKDVKEGDYLIRPHILPVVEKQELDLAEYASEFASIDETSITRYRNILNRWGNTMVSRRGTVLPREINITPRLMRLIGYFIAEGCTSNSSIHFTFHKDETEFHEDIARLSKEIFGIQVKTMKGPGSLTICINNTELAGIWRKIFGQRIENKKLPEWILLLPLELQKELLEGWFKGDGHIRRSDGRYELTTVSKTLAYQLELLLQRQGILVNIIHEKRSRRNNNEKDAYKLYWIPNRRSGREFKFIQDNKTLVKCSSVREEFYDGELYDLTVMGNPGFLVEGYAVHNTRQWKKYEGRPCCHVLALYWDALQNPPAGGGAQPAAPPTPTPGGGVTVNQGLIAPVGQPPMNVPLIGPEEAPAPMGPEEAPQPAWSEVVQPGKEEGTITFPGTFSHWKEASDDPFRWSGHEWWPFAIDKNGQVIYDNTGDITNHFDLLTQRGISPGYEQFGDLHQDSRIDAVGVYGNGHIHFYEGDTPSYREKVLSVLPFQRIGSNWKESMAERSGDPKLDLLIQQYVQENANRMKLLRTQKGADGACEDETDEFVSFLLDNGIKARRSNIYGPSPPNLKPKWDREYWDVEDYGYSDRPLPGNPNWGGQHTTAIVETKYGIFSVDFTAAQYGYSEFPMVLRLNKKKTNPLFDPGDQWQRSWKEADYENPMQVADQYKYGWKPGGLQMWPVNSTTGDPHHFEVLGPNHERYPSGRVYYYGPNKVVHHVWINRGTEYQRAKAAQAVNQWSLQNLGAPITHTKEVWDEGLDHLAAKWDETQNGGFKNGDIVRVWEETQGYAQPAYGQPGYPVTIKKNQSGEVLSSDEELTVAIFPLKTGPLEHHLVKVECPTANLYLDNTNAAPFIKRH